VKKNVYNSTSAHLETANLWTRAANRVSDELLIHYKCDSCRQKCALVFGAWSYHTTKMNLTVRDTTVNLDSYRRNGEWSILSTEVVRDEFSYAGLPMLRFCYLVWKRVDSSPCSRTG